MASAFALTLLATAAAAQSVRVERVGPARVATDPGASVAVAFRVANPSRAAAPVVVSVPRGWPSLSPEAEAALEPGASGIRLLATAVPRGTAVGDYVLRLRAGAAGDSAVVSVRPRRAVDVAVEDAPRFVVLGSEYRARFRVTNRGNAPASLRLSVESALGFPARADARALELAPGQGAAVEVAVATRETEGAAAHRLTLRAAGDGAGGSSTAVVALVRRSARGAVAMRTVPATVALRAAPGMDARGGVPGAVSAAGDVPGAGHVDLFYRGRGAASPETGEQEQLSLSVRGRRGELRLGDQFWGVSPLTSPGRAGYGAGGRVAAGPLWAEGFSARNRFAAAAPRQSGAAVGIGSRTTFLSADWFDAGNGAPAAVSLRGRVEPARGVAADAEIGEAGGARAGYARLYASRGGANLDLRRIEADAAFPGDQHGRSLLQASGGVRLPAGLRARAGYERERRADTLGLVLAGTRLDASTAYASLAFADWLTVERRAQMRDGVSAAGSFARRADSWVASASLPGRRVTLAGGAEVGRVDDAVSGESGPFARTWLRAGVRQGIGSAWAGVERRTGTSVETGTEQDRVTGSLSVQLQPSPDTRVSLLAQAGAMEFAEQPDGIVDGTIEQRLPGGHTLRLRMRAFPWAPPGRRKPLLLLDYVVPLRVPVARDRSTGAISGSVVDEETGRPVADVLVRAGDRAVVTDGRGRWSIAGLVPGTYTVEVDPVSVGVGRVVARPDALKVDVAGGRENAVEIGVSRAAKVEGRVFVTDPDDGDGGVDGAVVEIRRGNDRRRRITDASGRFLFSDLPPGEWTVTVLQADLPPHHALERETAAVTLAAGASASVELRAVPRKREMVMVSGGDLVLGGAASRPASPSPSVTRIASAVPSPSAPRPQRIAPGLLNEPAAPRRTTAGVPPSPAAPAQPAARESGAADGGRTMRDAAVDRPELRVENRPWRQRGESGLADWPNDTYVVDAGDESLTAIAWLVYRDGSLWPRIWLANRSVLPSPDRLAPGVELVIPPPGPLTAEEREAAREYAGRRAPARRR